MNDLCFKFKGNSDKTGQHNKININSLKIGDAQISLHYFTVFLHFLHS